MNYLYDVLSWLRIKAFNSASTVIIGQRCNLTHTSYFPQWFVVQKKNNNNYNVYE